MEPEDLSFGPLQLLVVGFPDLDHFTGRIAREMAALRGRGLIRVLDARMLSRDPDGTLTETDLNAVIGEEVGSAYRPVAHLFGLNGHAEVNGAADGMTPETFARTAGFEIQDLRRLTEEIAAGEHAAVVLVEHVWAGTLQAGIRAANGLLIAQGMLTPEVMMIVGAELQAKADAETAIELAEAARGAALLDAIRTLSGDTLEQRAAPACRRRRGGRPRARRRGAARRARGGRGDRRPGAPRDRRAGDPPRGRRRGRRPARPARGRSTAGMSEAAERHAAFVAQLRRAPAAPAPVLDAFARVPRHVFLPGVPLDVVYDDDAIVTHDVDGVPTSSSTQPSLMARMVDLLDVRPGHRVLEIGTGTGYNAAILAELGAAVTTVELLPDVAGLATTHLREAGIETGTPGAGAVHVVAGDGAAPPPGRYDRVIFTAGCWSLPAVVIDALADDGVLVAPLRINGIELLMTLRREGAALRGAGGIPCGFLPMRADGHGGRGADERPWRWPLGAGGVAIADADLGVEGRGALDRVLATPGRDAGDPLGLAADEAALDALLWLGLDGDPLITLLRRGERRAGWTVALDVLPASLLVFAFANRFHQLDATTLHGGQGALRACAESVAAWRAAGSPGPHALSLTVEPAADRSGWSLPARHGGGAATALRGAHRWTLDYES